MHWDIEIEIPNQIYQKKIERKKLFLNKKFNDCDSECSH